METEKSAFNSQTGQHNSNKYSPFFSKTILVLFWKKNQISIKKQKQKVENHNQVSAHNLKWACCKKGKTGRQQCNFSLTMLLCSPTCNRNDEWRCARLRVTCCFNAITPIKLWFPKCTGRAVMHSFLEREDWGLNLGTVKLDTVLPRARHRCDISSKGAV